VHLSFVFDIVTKSRSQAMHIYMLCCWKQPSKQDI